MNAPLADHPSRWSHRFAELGPDFHTELRPTPLPAPYWVGTSASAARWAGFDADHRDPLAQLNWGPEDFSWLTGKLLDFADRACGGRVVSLLEGGYDRQGLSEGVAAHVSRLMGR